MKNKYFFIWVEGLCPKTGEKIKSITYTDHEYTTKMMKALRVKEEDKNHVKKRLVIQGVSEKYVTFIPTSYAPKGTIFNGWMKIK